MATMTRKRKKRSKIKSKKRKRFNFAGIVSALRAEGKWHIKEAGRSLELSRMERGKPITIQLHYRESQNMWEIAFPVYPFQSSVSYFTPKKEEMRICRNRKTLASAIKVLRNSEAWNWISNKDFIEINKKNARFTRTQLRNALKEMILG